MITTLLEKNGFKLLDVRAVGYKVVRGWGTGFSCYGIWPASQYKEAENAFYKLVKEDEKDRRIYKLERKVLQLEGDKKKLTEIIGNMVRAEDF